jgi:hypothetical protein
MILIVHGRTKSGLLSRDGVFDPDMREALANAAQRYGLTVNLPSVADLQVNQINIDTAEITPADRFLRVAELSDSELPLVGDLRWSDAALGWIANWRLAVNGRGHRWSVSGVNYDEAFRNAVRGAARLLSGNGGPLFWQWWALIKSLCEGGRALQQTRSANVRFGSKADIPACSADVRFTPKSGHYRARLGCPLVPKADFGRANRQPPTPQIAASVAKLQGTTSSPQTTRSVLRQDRRQHQER